MIFFWRYNDASHVTDPQLQKDPDEIINFYSKPEYKETAQELQKELFRQMKLYQEPLKKEELK